MGLVDTYPSRYQPSGGYAAKNVNSIPGEPNSQYVNMTGTAGAKAWRAATFLEERKELPLLISNTTGL